MSFAVGLLALIGLAPSGVAAASSGGTTAPQEACAVTSAYGHSGYYLCGSTPVEFQWDTGLVEDVVVGSDYHVYHDPGSGWARIGNGEASHTLPPAKVGIGTNHSNTIGVFGTTGLHYCSTGNGYGGWTGWVYCP
ncbi:hypothetical protein [Amycolatopsis sp. NBC_01480]|jgi:hypothetical protein|uniref:hypothetical protein n=1 Tax=Amycolatopsis sp. NBC_01480 TaxID=2903562 RepID=UPI002E283CB4|nr:hypothetical protein [Amycolatopsis sp. NBC_01480]